jgi:SAM-dependent methyltransferase
MAAQDPEPSHWNAYAARWSLVGPPLRPCAEDVSYVQDSVARLLAPRLPTDRALLLGVTPELARIEWQPPLPLLAVDRSEGMVRGVWPGDTALRRAIVADWHELYDPHGSFALVLGDGVLSLLEYPNGYRRLGQQLARLVQPEGLLSLRLFCRPERLESVDDVFAALAARRIGNFHIFKWRLAMAMQGAETHGVQLSDIWNEFSARIPSQARLAADSGFGEPEISTIDAYRDVSDRYSFSTEAEVMSVLEPDFALVETWRPDYELGDRCPHLTFRRRA